MMRINNIPHTTETYIVAREILSPDGIVERWYWGSWSDRKQANEVALELADAIVIENKPRTQTFTDHLNSLYDTAEREYKGIRHKNTLSAEMLRLDMMFLQKMILD